MSYSFSAGCSGMLFQPPVSTLCGSKIGFLVIGASRQIQDGGRLVETKAKAKTPASETETKAKAVKKVS